MTQKLVQFIRAAMITLAIVLMCLIPGLLLIMFLFGSAFEMDLTSTSTGAKALERIESERSGDVPKLATDFFYWDEGFLSDHTTYWSFTFETLADCQSAASPVRSNFSGTCLTDADFHDWSPPELDFILNGPAYFGERHATDKWDMTKIRRGSSALLVDYDQRNSELQYTAIDYDTLRVYRLRWWGSSLTHAFDDVGYTGKPDTGTRGH